MTVQNVSLQTAILEYLQLDSDSPSGLSWRKKTGRKAAIGKPAIKHVANTGYYRGAVAGMHLYAHRAVYFLATGEWPARVDHIDGNRLNNTPSNLREVSASENLQNTVCRGYYKTRTGKWLARVQVDRITHCLGTFGTEAEARTAYEAGKRKLHPTAPDRCYESQFTDGNL